MVITGWTFFYCSILFTLFYHYFCLLSNTVSRWHVRIIYLCFSSGVAFLRYFNWIGDYLYILLEILLLASCGSIIQKIRFWKALAIASLEISIQCVIAGILQSFYYGIVDMIHSKIVFTIMVYSQYVAEFVLLIISYRLLVRLFNGYIQDVRQSILTILMAPILFFIIIEAFLSDTVYGHIFVINSGNDLIYPRVDYLQMLMLQLLAGIGLISIFFAYKRLIKALDDEQIIQIMKQQSKSQEVYIAEAVSRYKQTRAFRHDIKNHLLVLRRLLEDNRVEEADKYLEHLEDISLSLSYPIQTGNHIMDALLGSKLAVAAEKGIHIDCDICIPKHSGVSDIDWSIVLSNALDNAIHANEAVEYDKRISISGGQKGNIYLLEIENRCLLGTKVPKQGIGLSNINAVIVKYNGKFEIEISHDIFKLCVLFVIPQQSCDSSQQTD